MAKDYDFDAEEGGKVLYDLRQTYAVYILTPILLKIEEARMKNDFKELYNLLTSSLHTNIYQKLEDDERKEFEKLHQKVIRILNENSSAFNGHDKRIESVYKVQNALKEIELWLKVKMEEHGLYGKGAVWDADEI